MSSTSVFQSVHTLLKGNTALMAAVKGVFDSVPDEQAGPYIVVGELQTLSGRLLDWQERAWSVDLHIWSSYRGKKEVLSIADKIIPIIPAEWFTEELYILQDSSGWYHGILTVRGYDR